MPKPAVETEAYSIDEFPDVLGISKRHARYLIKAGRIASLKIGAGVLVPKAVVKELLEGTIAKGGQVTI